MKTITWKRKNGFVSVVLFANKKSAAYSTKTYKTKAGAEAANKRLAEICGENWELMNLPYTSADAKTGEITVNYIWQNLTGVK
jgi:hypothetical protein